MKHVNTSIKLFSVSLLLAGVLCTNLNRAAAASPEGKSSYKEAAKDEPRARMDSEKARQQIDASATLQKATELYAAVVKGKHGEVPESVLAKAQCVAVIPDVATAALIVGGSHGTGVASCRENSHWSNPAFVALNAVSFGAQIGGKSTDLVLFMVNSQAKAALKSGTIALGTDVSVTAGTFDRSLDTSTHGVIAYNRTEGAFAGAALSGGNLSSDETSTTAFYGKEVKLASLLEGSAVTGQNAHIDRFTTLLPR